MFEVLTGEHSPQSQNHDALEDAEILSKLFWEFVKGDREYCYPLKMKNFQDNLHKLNLNATRDFFLKIKSRRKNRRPVKGDEGVVFVPIEPLCKFIEEEQEHRGSSE